MQRSAAPLRSLALCAALGAITLAAGCGSKEPPQAPAEPAPATTAPTPTPVTAAEVTQSWTPEALEELLAPVALYPDPVLSQLLIASTNPQEVLDAGNWLLQNTGLEGKALDDAAAAVGFTPPIRALVQFPATIDMMCLELGWTTELGEAFVADQAGVLDAVQRLRQQAIDAGNLQSSAQMKVETEEQDGKEVVVLKPAEPQVVYVPQYDPVAAYAPAPAAAATPAATTTATEEKKGYTTGQMVTTGLLAFGAGILVAEIFEDDDDYYYPRYGYGGIPYYPPYPYRPVYGGGYYPSNGYNRPPNYNSGFQNTGTIIVNTGGNRPSGGYWDRYDDKPGSGAYKRPSTTSSPITAARPDRPELNALNQRQARPMPADVKRPSADATAANWKGQGGYAGAAAKAGTRDRPQAKAPPKIQGSYAGAKADRTQPTPARLDTPKPQTREVQKPKQGGGDRGYARPTPEKAPAARPQTADRPATPKPMPTARPAPSAGNRGTALSGTQGGSRDRAASQRGQQSLPQGARSKGGGGNHKQRR
jgi:hypothetical protein